MKYIFLCRNIEIYSIYILYIDQFTVKDLKLHLIHMQYYVHRFTESRIDEFLSESKYIYIYLNGLYKRYMCAATTKHAFYRIKRRNDLI